jgi:hypothetical protein
VWVASPNRAARGPILAFDRGLGTLAGHRTGPLHQKVQTAYIA